MEDKLREIQKITEKILELLKIKAKVKLEEDKENKAIKVQIESDEAGILIGRHGETLNAFQLILSLIVNKNQEGRQRIILNVGNYREKRAEELKNLALNTAQKVKFSGKPIAIPNLSPFERRIVHLYLADHPDVTTESEGEGKDRRLVVKPKVK